MKLRECFSPRKYKLLLTLLILLITSKSFAQCPDGPFSDTNKPPFFVYPITNEKVVLFCGYFDKFLRDYTYASEYSIFIVNGKQLLSQTDTGILSFGATDSTRIKIIEGILQIEELVYFPRQDNTWESYPRYLYIFNNDLLKFERHYVLVPPKLSPEAIDNILAKIPSDKSNYSGSVHISTEIMLAAMSGSKKAIEIFNNLTNYFIVDGHFAETYHEDQKTYNEYLKYRPVGSGSQQ